MYSIPLKILNCTPLHFACAKNCFEIVDILLQNKETDINARSRVFFSLMIFQLNYLKFMEFEIYVKNCTPIYFAVKLNNIECVKVLLQNDLVDLNFENKIFTLFF